MAGGATGILGSLRILVDADTAKAQKALQSFGGRAQVAGAAIGAGIGVAGIAALRIGDEYDSMLDGIRSATGATGDELAKLESVTNSVSGRVTEDMGVVGQATTELFRKTKDASEGTVESLVDLARMTGTEYGAAFDKVTDLYVNWNVAAQDQVATNDMLLRAYQASGVGIDALSESLDKNGAVLRALGFGLDDSVALLATLEKAGMDAGAVMGPLRKSISSLVKAGKDPKEALTGIFDAIKNAPDDIKATALAIETFGGKGAGMAQLIREGKLEVGEMFAAISDGEETVQGASDDTRDWAEGFKELANQAKAAIGPMASMFAGLSDAMGNAIFLLPALTGAIGKGVGKMAQKFGGLFANATADAAAGPLRAGLTKMMAKIGLEGAATSLATRFAGLFAAALPLVGVAALGVAIGVAIGKAIVGPEVEKAMKDEASKVSGALVGATTIAELDRQRKVLEKGLSDAEALPFSNFLFGSSDQLRQQIADIDAKKAELVAAATKLPSPPTAQAEAAGATVGTATARGIKRGFRLASAAAVAGFGSVKDALQNPPKLRTKAWRLDHLQKQMRGVMSNLRKAIKVGDPFAIRYWETARAKVEGQQARLRKRTVATMGEVKRTYKKAGVDVEGTWADIKNTTDSKSQAASTKAISEAQQTKQGIDAVNLRASGIGMMTELANGIYAGIPSAAAASRAAAAAVAAPLEAHSPPKVGPLSSIDTWGAGLVDAWLSPIRKGTGKVRRVGDELAGALAPRPRLNALAMAGGMAGGGRAGGSITNVNVGTFIGDKKGLDQLDRKLAGRRRIKRRDRRRVDSPNGQGR